MDAHPDPVPVELQPLLDELGRELDRAFLEVVAEREVAEHLEEGQVVGVEADLVDVGRAENLLRGRGQRGAGGGSRPRKYGICGCMPAVVEQRRAVVRARDERRRGATQMALLLEEGEKALADLIGGAHERPLYGEGFGRPAS